MDIPTFHTIADCPPLKDEVDVILLPEPESWQLPVLSFQKFPSFRGDARGAQPVPLKQTYLRRDGSASDAIERCTSIDTLCFRGPMYSHIDPTVAWAKMATVGSICEDIGTVKHIRRDGSASDGVFLGGWEAKAGFNCITAMLGSRRCLGMCRHVVPNQACWWTSKN